MAPEGGERWLRQGCVHLFRGLFCQIGLYIHFGIFLRIQNGRDGYTEVGGWSPEIYNVEYFVSI